MKRLTSKIQMKNGTERITYDVPFGDFANAAYILAKRLAYYEDLEEQGLLLRLPSEIHGIDKSIIEYSLARSINLARYGVDIGDKFETAIETSYALSKAYNRGRQDEIDRIYRLREELEAKLRELQK